MTDPDWYQDATIYSLDIKTFNDADGDGWGDFAGATERLGYLAELGVDALWVRPFYPSPLRDNGYDVDPDSVERIVGDGTYHVAEGGVTFDLDGCGYVWIRGEQRGGAL